jgi:uncharacterized protein (TIGR02271 family)
MANNNLNDPNNLNDRDRLLRDDETLREERLEAGRRDLREDEARITLSEEQLAVGKREREVGEVEIGKRVETEHVRQAVSVSHEEVEIERRPLDGMHAAGAEIREEHLSVPVRAEEVVAEKRVVPVEEVVARKREVVEEQPVEAELRREEVEVREQGNVHLRDGQRDLRDRT